MPSITAFKANVLPLAKGICLRIWESHFYFAVEAQCACRKGTAKTRRFPRWPLYEVQFVTRWAEPAARLHFTQHRISAEPHKESPPTGRSEKHPPKSRSCAIFPESHFWKQTLEPLFLDWVPWLRRASAAEKDTDYLQFSSSLERRDGKQLRLEVVAHLASSCLCVSAGRQSPLDPLTCELASTALKARAASGNPTECSCAGFTAVDLLSEKWRVIFSCGITIHDLFLQFLCRLIESSGS